MLDRPFATVVPRRVSRAGDAVAPYDAGSETAQAAGSDSVSARLPPSLARRFEAAVFDWDGTAVVDRHADASALRQSVEGLSRAGFDIGIVTGTNVGNVDAQLRVRPEGPGRVYLSLNRGSEVFTVGTDGPQLV